MIVQIVNLILIFLTCSNLICFKNINEAKDYALNFPEFVESDNQDLDYPDFTSFYEKTNYTRWKKFLTLINLKKAPAWKIEDFHTLLLKVTKEGLAPHNFEQLQQQPFIASTSRLIEANSETQIILWGKLYGAFHSLVRDLSNLILRGIINNEFKIIKPNTYLVFNGNAIDLNAYSLETLTLILRILDVNPEMAIYIRGSHEDKQYWYNFNTAKELKIRARHISSEFIPLSKLLTQFFATLPLSLFINITGQGACPTDLAVISYFGPDSESYQNLLCNINNLPKQLQNICDQNLKLDSKYIKWFIIGDDPAIKNNFLRPRDFLHIYRHGMGLYHLSENIQGVRSWTTISCPIKVYRMRYGFVYDSYSVIKINGDLEKSSIQVFFNGSKNSKFQTGSKYNLFNGNLLERGENPSPSTIFSKTFWKKFNLEDLLNRIKFVQQRFDLLKNKFNSLKDQLKTQLKVKVKDYKIPNLNDTLPIISKLKKRHDPSTMPISDLTLAYEAVSDNYDGLVSDVNDVFRKLGKFKVKIKQTIEDKQPENYGRYAPIVLGSSAPFSGAYGNAGNETRMGMSLRFAKENKTGGINGKYIQAVMLDDKYDPVLARNNIEKLINLYATNLIISPAGTATMQAYLDIIKQENKLFLFPNTGSMLFRNPELKSIINLDPSFYDQAKALTNFVLNKYGAQKILVVYQVSEYKNAVQIIKKTLEKYGKLQLIELPYDEGQSDFKDIERKIVESNSNIIAFFSSGVAALRIIKEIGLDFFANKILYAPQGLGDIVTLKVLEDMGLKIILAQWVPDPINSELEIVKEYRADCANYGLRPNSYSLSGYLRASIFIDQINKIKGSINAESIIKQFESIKDYNFKGLELNFNRDNRTIGQNLWIVDTDGTWIKKNIIN